MANEYLLKPPKEQLFYKMIATIMCLGSLNAHYWSWYKMPKSVVFHVNRYLVYYLVPITTVSQVLYLVLNYSESEFDTLYMIYTILPVSFMVSLKFCIAQTQSYKKAMKDFMPKIHLHSYYLLNRDTYVKQTLITAEKFSRLTYYYYVGIWIICATSFETVPIVHNWQNIESLDNITTRLEIFIHLWLPFDYEFNFYSWAMVQTFMFYLGSGALIVVCFFDSINLVFLYHVIGHIKILKHKILTFPKGTTEEEIKQNLIDISRYHTFISRIIGSVEAAFGLNVAGIYLHNFISGGLFIFQIMTSGAETDIILTYGLMIPIYMGFLVFLSLTLEDVRIKGDEIPDLIYALRWEKMSLSNQKLVLMILCQVQPPLEFKAAFNIKTGMQPAISIIKTTFSFYVMIKSRI